MATMPRFLHMARYNFQIFSYVTTIMKTLFEKLFLVTFSMHFFNFIFIVVIIGFLFSLCKTGSGKTYTMGTNYHGEGSNGGIIPRVLETIFSRVNAMKESTDFLIRVSFIEVKDTVTS